MADEMLWSTQSGFLTNTKLNMHFQTVAQPLMRFRQFVDIKEAFGKNAGESVNWLKVANQSGSGRDLIETNVMPEAQQPLSWGTGSVKEVGISIPFTFKVETLSKFDIKSIIKKSLLNDARKVIDGNVERQFNQTPLRYVGTSATGFALTTNGTATAINTSILNSYHVRKMKLELEKRDIEPYDGSDYVCICSLEALESLEGALESVNQYTETGYKKLLNGEVGRLHGVRFVKDSHASRKIYNSTTGALTAKSWSGGYALDAYMFGADTVREIITVPEEIRLKVTTDYGRSKGIAWYGLFGWVIEWDDEPNARIIKWDSAS